MAAPPLQSTLRLSCGPNGPSHVCDPKAGCPGMKSDESEASSRGNEGRAAPPRRTSRVGRGLFHKYFTLNKPRKWFHVPDPQETAQTQGSRPACPFACLSTCSERRDRQVRDRTTQCTVHTAGLGRQCPPEGQLMTPQSRETPQLLLLQVGSLGRRTLGVECAPM